MSLRIIGAGADDAEIAFINASAAYEARFGILPELFAMDYNLIDEIVDDDPDTEQAFTVPPMVTNLEPLRFFYNGLSQVDDIAACIYFYRTLEYFSFFTNANEMTKLRHDAAVSDTDFSRKILELVSRDEKGPVFKLIAALADGTILASAVTDGLIKSPVANVLCEALYAFRNSIVHGKFSYGYSLQSDLSSTRISMFPGGRHCSATWRGGPWTITERSGYDTHLRSRSASTICPISTTSLAYTDLTAPAVALDPLTCAATGKPNTPRNPSAPAASSTAAWPPPPPRPR